MAGENCSVWIRMEGMVCRDLDIRLEKDRLFGFDCNWFECRDLDEMGWIAGIWMEGKDCMDLVGMGWIAGIWVEKIARIGIRRKGWIVRDLDGKGWSVRILVEKVGL